MKKLLWFYLVCLPAFANSDSNTSFSLESIAGVWKSNWTSVPGEKQTLTFQEPGDSKFLRIFPDGDEIHVSASISDTTILDDIILIEYYDGDFGIRYKLVLSGWHVEEGGKRASAIYGTMFLYQNGRQFNGFPVSFRPAS
ncbi:hypothetical protein [Parahaliea mediterranea]|uniref:DUF1579 domain-containing protein n=1 Tax=Parahaliea mediterranea TaxID=651086 RepID=A0A939DJA7_9GAMM|nr:hypothetical protein [Parahaliea mediterranea]MBN7799195.1 hypothetical protein [Parahaliea mediterranea]